MWLFQAGPWTSHSLLSWIPGLWSCYLPCSLLHESWTPHLKVTAAKAAPRFHTPDQLFLVSIRSNRASPLVGCFLVSGSHLQCIPETSSFACALLYCPSSRYWGGQSLHEDQGLCMWGLFQLSEEGHKIQYVFLIRWYVADNYHNIADFGLLSDSDL